MFQKSLLKNFVKSFNTSNYDTLKKLCLQNEKIDEDANGAEFLAYLAEFLEWSDYTRKVKNNLDMKKADGVVYSKENQPIEIVELKSRDKKISNRDIIAQAFRYKSIGKQIGGGSFEYLPNGVGKLPIPNISKEEQEPFILLVDTIINTKENIAKYNKHFDSLNAVDKIEIKEAIEKLEAEFEVSVDEIDRSVYGLYGLSGDEVEIVEGGNG